MQTQDIYKTGFYDKRFHYTHNMKRGFVTGDYLKKGMLIQLAILGEPLFVMKLDDIKMQLVGVYTGLVFEQERNGFYKLIKGEAIPEKMMNTNSGISHYILNGTGLCGTVKSGASDLVTTNSVNCSHCLENYKNINGGK